MAKSKVRIEGEQTVSTAAEKASRSVRQLKEEIQKNLGPLKQLRDTFNAAFVATGALAAVRSIVSEVTKLTNAYKEHERAIYGVKLAAQDTAAGALTRMDEAMAKLNVERGRAIATFFRGLIEWYAASATEAAKALKIHNDYIDALGSMGKGKGPPTQDTMVKYYTGRVDELKTQIAELEQQVITPTLGGSQELYEQLKKNADEVIEKLKGQLGYAEKVLANYHKRASADLSAAAAAKDALEYQKQRDEAFVKTEPGRLAALQAQIDKWKLLKTKHEEDAEVIDAILLPLYDELEKKTAKRPVEATPESRVLPDTLFRGKDMEWARSAGIAALAEQAKTKKAALEQFDAAQKLIGVLPNEAEAFDSVAYAAQLAAERMDNFTTTAQTALGQAKNALAGIDAVISQSQRNREIELENEYQTRKDGIEASITDEKKRATAIEALDKEFAPKRAALQTRGAKAAKASAIMGATMNTAEAVIAALASVKPTVPLGVAASIAAGVIGAAQIAVIAAQPIPKFARGGSFVVPPGYPNDSYRMAVESGEQVTVTPAAAVDAGGGEPLHVTVMLEGKVLFDAITRASRERRVLIHAGAVV